MKLPNQIRVGFKPVKVIRRSDEPDDVDNGGTFSEKNRAIFIATDMPEHEQALAVLHEMVHLFLSERDVDMPLRIEEAVCDAVSRGLAEVIANHPALLPSVRKALLK